MLSKEEIETCKEELLNYIEFMESAGDNAGWARGLKWYIEQLETDKQKLIKKLEEVCEKVDDEMADFEAIDLKHKILEVLKGEKE